MKNKINEYRDLVIEVLSSVEEARDSDEVLLAVVWGRCMQDLGYDLEEISATGVFSLLSRGEFPKAEGITRCRRKVQEQIPELRGALWDIRHEHADSVAEEMKRYH
jgi:hypothetical protein